jgi:hypothetical protein
MILPVYGISVISFIFLVVTIKLTKQVHGEFCNSAELMFAFVAPQLPWFQWINMFL